MIVSQARDQMMRDATDALPPGTYIVYPDKPSEPPADAQWARITLKHALRRQRGMGDQIRKYISAGVMCIEIFSIPGDGHTMSDATGGTTVLNLENNHSSPITYRNIRFVDIGSDGGFTKVNVYADFEYEHHH